MRIRRATTATIAVALSACAPALDWREVRIADTSATLTFPCRPQRQSRRLVLAGATVVLDLHVCSADGATWGLATTDVADPARVGSALGELAAAAYRNFGAAQAPGRAADVTGATPNPAMRRHDFDGRLPDGGAVRARVLVFAKGTRVFQASVFAPAGPDDMADTFFGSIGVGS